MTQTLMNKSTPSLRMVKGGGDDATLVLRKIDDAVWIPALKIEPNPDQPRREFPAAELAGKAKSIRSLRAKKQGIGGSGILLALLVRRPPGSLGPKGNMRPGFKYQIVDGERRWRAGVDVGLKEFPCIIQDQADDDAYKSAVIANILRSDMTPLEEALAFRSLMNINGMSIRALADELGVEGKGRGYIHNRLLLLQIGEDVQTILTDKRDSLSAAQMIDKVKDNAELRADLIKQYSEGAITYSQVESAVRKWNARGSRTSKAPKGTIEVPVYELIDADDILKQGRYGRERDGLLPVVPSSDPGAALGVAMMHAQSAAKELSVMDIDKADYRKRIKPQVKALRQLVEKMEAIGEELGIDPS